MKCDKRLQFILSKWNFMLFLIIEKSIYCFANPLMQNRYLFTIFLGMLKHVHSVFARVCANPFIAGVLFSNKEKNVCKWSIFNHRFNKFSSDMTNSSCLNIWIVRLCPKCYKYGVSAFLNNRKKWKTKNKPTATTTTAAPFRRNKKIYVWWNRENDQANAMCVCMCTDASCIGRLAQYL